MKCRNFWLFRAEKYFSGQIRRTQSHFIIPIFVFERAAGIWKLDRFHRNTKSQKIGVLPIPTWCPGWGLISKIVIAHCSVSNQCALLHKTKMFCRYIKEFGLKNKHLARSAGNRTKLQAAWFVSHCATQARREKYAKSMDKYMDVHIYGDCSRQQLALLKLAGFLVGHFRSVSSVSCSSGTLKTWVVKLWCKTRVFPA